MIQNKVVRGAVVVLGACLLMLTGHVLAYEVYSTATGPDGNCANCHGEFRGPAYGSFVDGAAWGNDLHRPHVDWVSGLCDTCHNGLGIGRTVILNQATGNGLLDPVACIGCHGRDEGGILGVSGVGLQQHHFNVGVRLCADASCHPSADPAVYTPVGEDVQPPSYGDPDAGLFTELQQDPCNDLANGIFPEEGRFGVGGLDNDGDLAYDTADPDCEPLAIFLEFFRGEVAGRSGVMLRWKTIAEIDNAGFWLSRVRDRRPPEVIGFMGAQGSDLFGAEYEFLDDAHQKPGAVVYFLEDVDVFGRRTRHAPAMVVLPRAVGTPPGRDRD